MYWKAGRKKARRRKRYQNRSQSKLFAQYGKAVQRGIEAGLGEAKCSGIIKEGGGENDVQEPRKADG